MQSSLLAGLLALIVTTPSYAAPVAKTCSIAASTWLASLNGEQLASATRTFDHEGRRDWTNLPGARHRKEGLPFEDMTGDQRILAHRLLQCGLSSQGYQKAVGIMWVDDYLFAKLPDPEIQAVINRGYDFYWLAIFGDPASDSPWGWQLDGHHLALNFTVANGTIEVTPAFIGIQPNEIPDGPYAGWRILGEEEDKAIALLETLDGAQRALAIVAEVVPDEIFTGPGRTGELLEIVGLPASQMTELQRSHLLSLIEEYVENVTSEAASSLLARIAADGPEALHFAWMGGTSRGEGFYYRIHSPSVLIEFDHTLNIGLIQQGVREIDVNHIHTVMRQPNGDYGEDLLRKHYEESHRNE